MTLQLNNNSYLDSVLMKNYTFNFTNTVYKAGGVVINVKKSLVFTQKTNIVFTSTSYKSVQLELSIRVNNEEILVGLIYCHQENSISGYTKQFSEFY